jgi:predicted RNase H-like nuclease (RuvC/YqgF family)
MPPADPTLDPAAMPPADPAAPIDPAAAPGETDTTEEIDITDLVNMTKSLKKDVEDNKNENGDVIGKMDDVFTKLSDLESKLSQMDQVMAKIDELGAKVDASKPKTGVEKLEMRSLDSYPFNEKPQEFFAHKQGEMQASGKNEYVLTKNEVDNYPTDTIKTSFNPEQQEDEYKF